MSRSNLKRHEFHDGRIILHHGDCRAVLRTLEDNSVDSVVTDPPYALESIRKRFGSKSAAPCKHGKDGAFKRVSRGFMGQEWDTGATAFDHELWVEVWRVLKPGGHAFIFGGDRTYHRLACAIEDAGLEIRRMFIWAYGQGFPKSHNVSKAIDKSAGVEGTYGDFKTSAHNRIWPNTAGHEGYRRPWRDDDEKTDRYARLYIPASEASREWEGWGTDVKPAIEPICLARKPLSEKTVAANVLKWGTGALNIEGCRVPADGEDLTRDCIGLASAQNDGWRRPWMGKAAKQTFGSANGRWPANLLHDGSEEVKECFPDSSAGNGSHRGTNKNTTSYKGSHESDIPISFGDSGSASRFFAEFPPDTKRIFYTAKAGADDRLGSMHPTVKPVALLQWLVKLITPKGGLCLDPFAGTGTIAEACFREGIRCLLIEREDKYIDDIRRRMRLMTSGPDERGRESIKARGLAADAGPLFREITAYLE